MSIENLQAEVTSLQGTNLALIHFAKALAGALTVDQQIQVSKALTFVKKHDTANSLFDKQSPQVRVAKTTLQEIIDTFEVQVRA
ncbi:hypothetical protein WAE61_18245 [Comamonadaceae bacterium PP-2]